MHVFGSSVFFIYSDLIRKRHSCSAESTRSFGCNDSNSSLSRKPQVTEAQSSPAASAVALSLSLIHI